MTDEETEDAFGAAELLESYIALWNRTFPSHVHRSHWHIISSICLEEGGVPFSVIRARLSESLGMDSDTCACRVQDIIESSLASINGNKLSPGTFISPSAELEHKFHEHSVNAINLFYSCAKMYGKTASTQNRINPGADANYILARFFDNFGDYWTERLGVFLRENVSSPAHRIRALRLIRTFPYWHILVTAWKHQQLRSPFRNKHLLIDDFHQKIFEVTSAAAPATKKRVEEMIAWGFLQRLDRSDGVPRNRFAVRMTQRSVEHFTITFAKVMPLAMNLVIYSVKEANEKESILNTTPKSEGTSTSLLTPNLNQNVKRTSQN